MQDADNDHGIVKGLVVDGIGAVKRDAQTRRELVARRCGKRKMPHRLEGGFDGGDKARGYFFGRVGGNTDPDFRKVGFGGFGDAQG